MGARPERVEPEINCSPVLQSSASNAATLGAIARIANRTAILRDFAYAQRNPDKRVVGLSTPPSRDRHCLA